MKLQDYTDVREPRTATGSEIFPFSAWFCSLPWTGKALVDDCGLTLQTRWRENAPKREKFKFWLLSVAQKRLCLSSLSSGTDPEESGPRFGREVTRGDVPDAVSL